MLQYTLQTSEDPDLGWCPSGNGEPEQQLMSQSTQNTTRQIFIIKILDQRNTYKQAHKAR